MRYVWNLVSLKATVLVSFGNTFNSFTLTDLGRGCMQSTPRLGQRTTWQSQFPSPGLGGQSTSSSLAAGTFDSRAYLAGSVGNANSSHGVLNVLIVFSMLYLPVVELIKSPRWENFNTYHKLPSLLGSWKMVCNFFFFAVSPYFNVSFMINTSRTVLYQNLSFHSK